MGFVHASVPTPLELADAEESLLHSQPHVSVYLSATHNLGPGTLHITSKRVLWLPDSAQPAANGYAIDFPQLLMHALSRDTAYFPHPAIYCQLERDDEEDEDEEEDGEKEADAGVDGGAEDAVGGDELTKAAEVRLVPDDQAARQTGTQTDTPSRMYQPVCVRWQSLTLCC